MQNFNPKFIADKLKSWGYDVVEGVGGTGVVASLTVGNGKRAIGIRADFDALPILEDNDLPYKSKVEGWSHLCGHDAHATMLLGAGKYLHRNLRRRCNAFAVHPAQRNGA